MNNYGAAIIGVLVVICLAFKAIVIAKGIKGNG